MFARVPGVVRVFYKGCVWRKKSKEKSIYLTFDDGPVPEVTPLVLDMLDEYGWKATFFCVGENVQKYPELYNEILRRGHRTGNHTFNHLKGFSTGVEEYVENVRKASVHIHSNLFRPPHGRLRQRQKNTLQPDYEIIMWDLLTCDYDKSLTPEQIINKVKRFSRNGSIVLFHDSIKAKNNMLAVLPRAIEFWNEQGYKSEIF
ncbi:polysaccharide deacetylase family protein [Paludibacter sp. 221]|nr:polysaccharide deacetylase family protein [Paludibacter sp. 221]NDV46561.1 polysaccharide deacetylase family protein [Paludibacter sp. 221]